MKYKKGLVLGKFYPFHKGHEFLIQESIKYCEHLTVLVCSLKSESIPGKFRFQWVKERFPNCTVIHVTDENPQVPEESDHFWEIWKSTIEKNHKGKIDILFTSEEYGISLSKVLNCEHRSIDLGRNHFPISGTKIRSNPLHYWDFLPENVKPYFVKKIVITGPESTGKTTLTKQLAEYFRTNFVLEYAREYLEQRNNIVNYEDIEPIARGHLEAEKKAIGNSNKFLFIDTDLIITKLYSSIYFQKVPDFVTNQIPLQKYDLHLLLTPDVPWVNDPLRDLPEFRSEFQNILIQNLQEYQIPFEIISGTFPERWEKAIHIIRKQFFEIN